MFEVLLVPQASLVAALLGLFSLVAGRKYFFISVAAIGFFIAAQAAKMRLGDATPDARTSILLLATLVAIACGVFTKMSRTTAIGTASYTIAGYIMSLHGSAWGFTAPGDIRLTFVIGGVIGALLVSFTAEFGVTALSALTGAHLILQYFAIEDELRKWLLLALTGLGILIQAGVLRKLAGSGKEAPKN